MSTSPPLISVSSTEKKTFLETAERAVIPNRVVPFGMFAPPTKKRGKR
jgi:hypothetical protein